MKAYKVTVLKRKKFKPTNNYGFADESVRIDEGDIFVGWSDDFFKPGKYFDLWLGDPHKENDVDNYVPFGRIVSVATRYNGKVFITKFCRILVQERKDGRANKNSAH